MLTKSRVIESIQTMSEELTIEDIIDKLQSLDDLETALNDITMGQVHKHETVMAEARQWLADKR